MAHLLQWGLAQEFDDVHRGNDWLLRRYVAYYRLQVGIMAVSVLVAAAVVVLTAWCALADQMRCVCVSLRVRTFWVP